jgi:hypothetical protein
MSKVTEINHNGVATVESCEGREHIHQSRYDVWFGGIVKKTEGVNGWIWAYGAILSGCIVGRLMGWKFTGL